MTIQATRAVLLSNLLRAGDARRIARLLDRLPAHDLSRLLAGLEELELRRAARVLLDERRCEQSVACLAPRAVARLVVAAREDDARRALEHMPRREAARVLLAMSEARRERLIDGLPEGERRRLVPALPRSARPRRRGEEGLGSVLRLRRLFA
ncbi:MAG: hypothetical protein ACQEXJ_09145 [Myxococcota bacterium]